MHGGADPEHVADGAPKGSTLAQSKVTPAEPQEGSIMGLVQGKSDIDLNGVLLNEDQVSFLLGAPKGSTLAQSKVTPAEPQVQGKSDIELN